MLQKNTIWGLLLSTGIGLALSSCHDDNDGRRFSEHTGGISPQVELTTSVISAKTETAARDFRISVSDLALKLTSADGSYSHTWESVDDFDPDEEFAIGEYTMEAYYGNPEVEGFDRPAYSGSTSLTVVENRTTPVSLTASMINSMITVEYTDEFKDYMTKWNVNITSSTGKAHYYGANETRALYVKPGNVIMDVAFTTPAGQSKTLRVATKTMQPRHHYHVTVGLTNRTGGTTLEVTFDETLNNNVVTIDLSDELLNAPAPTIEGHNLTEGGTYHYIEGDTPERTSLNIIARGGIAGVTITTNSGTLAGQGWDHTITLNSQTPESQRNHLANLGLDVRGIYNNPGKLAALDFTDVPPHLEKDPTSNEAEFTVTAVDKFGQPTEVPFTFTMKLTPIVISLSNPGDLPVGGTEMSLDLNYNGHSPKEKVNFYVLNSRGHWIKVPIKDIQPAGENKYRVTLTIPVSTEKVTVYAKVNVTNGGVTTDKKSEEIEVERTSLPALTISVPENSIWATKADVTITSTEADAELLANSASYFVSTDGSTYKKVTPSKLNGATATLTKLTPGKLHKVKVAFGDKDELTSAPVDFTTEADLPVPNGDFEDLRATYSANNREQGGEWSISRGIDYQTHVTYAIEEPVGWVSVNPKTMSGTNQNTWFAQPAVFNTSLTWSSTVPNIRVINQGGGTSTPDSFKYDPKSGNNAMVIRNVAWDDAGTTPSLWLKAGVGSDEYYNHNVPTVAHSAVGRMLLGSGYTYSNHKETYNEGVSFTSRPTTLTGWYRYMPDKNNTNDKGVVYIKLYNGDNLIASGSRNLDPANEYTQFSCPIKYIYADSPKATHLRIRIESSRFGKKGEPEEEHDIEVSVYLSRYEAYSHGATLVIDDLQFNYE